jgi:hypothetical protein
LSAQGTADTVTMAWHEELNKFTPKKLNGNVRQTAKREVIQNYPIASSKNKSSTSGLLD